MEDGGSQLPTDHTLTVHGMHVGRLFGPPDNGLELQEWYRKIWRKLLPLELSDICEQLDHEAIGCNLLHVTQKANQVHFWNCPMPFHFTAFTKNAFYVTAQDAVQFLSLLRRQKLLKSHTYVCVKTQLLKNKQQPGSFQ